MSIIFFFFTPLEQFDGLNVELRHVAANGRARQLFLIAISELDSQIG
jgi:hypothetical protein